MSPLYMLLKVDAEGRKLPIDCVTASCMDEAEDALAWLRRKHPERPELRLDKGEFFEILDEDHCPSEQWRDLAEALDESRKLREGERRAGLEGM